MKNIEKELDKYVGGCADCGNGMYITKVNVLHVLKVLEKGECNRLECRKYVEEDGIETSLGWFCSESCRKEIERNVMRVLL